MKKTYITPLTKSIELTEQDCLLDVSGSINGRYAGNKEEEEATVKVESNGLWNGEW